MTDTAAGQHGFEADDSGISCKHCGLPEPNARHDTTRHLLNEVKAHIVTLQEESSRMNRALASLYRAERLLEQRLTTDVGNGGTLADQPAASQGDSNSPS